MAKRPVRLIDVAVAADVSLATASQVMNNAGRVAPETRERVLDTAQRLNYRPNVLARSVASGQSQTIGVLAENVAGAFCMPVLIGINRALSSHDLASVLFDAAHDRDLRAEHVRHMVDRQVDGVIVIGEGPDVAIAPLTEPFVGPIVHAFGPPDPSGATAVGPDDEAGGMLAASRLIELGRTRIAHVTAGAATVAACDRSRGFSRTLAMAGLTPAAVLHGEFTRRWGFEAVDRLLETCPDLDAVFAGNDAIAIGLAAGLEARGRRVPDDVAIIGFDNVAGYSDDVEPYLESVDPRLAEVGRVAAEFLVARLSDPATPPPLAIAPVLAPGASTRGDSNSQRLSLVETLLRSSQSPPVGT